MSKKPKKKQTEWNKQGTAIADTSVPLYEANLKRMNKYLANPQKAMDNYLKKYYDNNVEQSDFIRNYNKAMSELTGRNYNATGGGYDTSNQRMYDDQQRYMNDLAARLRDKGVMSSYDMATGDYRNMLVANPYYQQAWVNGQPYSDVDQYNHLVKQYNSFGNQLMGVASGAGKVLSSIPNPWTQAIGAGLQTVGNTFGLDDTAGLNPNYYDSIAKGIAQTSQYGGDNWVTALTGGRNISGNQSLRDSNVDNTSTGQFTNFKDITSNLFNDKLAKFNIPSKFSYQK